MDTITRTITSDGKKPQELQPRERAELPQKITVEFEELAYHRGVGLGTLRDNWAEPFVNLGCDSISSNHRSVGRNACRCGIRHEW